MKLELCHSRIVWEQNQMHPSLQIGLNRPKKRANHYFWQRQQRSCDFWPLPRTGLQVNGNTLIARTPLRGSQRGCAKASVPTGITAGKANEGVPGGHAGGGRGRDPHVCIHGSLILKVFLSCHRETISSLRWHCSQSARLTEMTAHLPAIKTYRLCYSPFCPKEEDRFEQYKVI